MHYILVILVIILSCIKGDWKNWERYYPTMLYISVASFIYEFISHSHFHLWELEKDTLTLMGVHLMHNIVINPLIGFVFLSNYPAKFKSKILYFIYWIFLFWSTEWLAFRFHFISYHNGWNIWWSFLFVVIMFPMIRLHYVHKLRALILSAPIAALYLFLFDYL
ncbi:MULTISPECIES: CBO0543 family protein [Bacillaceae]|uniref:CBO0543 family protein n=1 Tax=Bacillaceae TaxID=186817 RepID=UPI000BA56DC2|nr:MULTISPECIES: CBO0543 family protein [Bacillaceae]PAE23933.1 hypothetical protein CHI10_15285 [Bacillus sp. 7894-2]